MATAINRDVTFEAFLGPFLSKEDGKRLFDQQARYYLDMSGEDFLRAWDAGEFKDRVDGPEHDRIMALIMLIPFAR